LFGRVELALFTHLIFCYFLLLHIGVDNIGAGVRYHLTLGYKVAAYTVGAASLAEAAIKLEKILRSIFVGFAWSMVVILLLNCVLILLLDLKTHQIGGLRT
jgi:hypothetical protein